MELCSTVAARQLIIQSMQLLVIESSIATHSYSCDYIFIQCDYTIYPGLLKQLAVQNKISQAKSSFAKFGKISTQGKNPLYSFLLG